MKCDQARDLLLDRLDGYGRLQPMSDLDLHLRECRACQTWYKQQKLAASALEKLESYPVPIDFTARVLAGLPERIPAGRRAWLGRPDKVLSLLGQVWSDLAASLVSPAGRRRLTPALVTAAAIFVVAVCLFAVLQGTGVPVTPGAAAGSPAGLIVAGSVALVVLGVLALLFLRQK